MVVSSPEARINFGQSAYWDTPHPGPSTDPDMVIKIPLTGELTTLPEWYTGYYLDPGKAGVRSKYIVSKGTGELFPVVSLTLRSDWGISFDIDRKILMTWVEQRRQWVGIAYHKWVESFPHEDESYGGPYVLDRYCLDRLSSHWEIPKDFAETLPQGILEMGPSDLVKVRAQTQSMPYSLHIPLDPEMDGDIYALDWDNQLQVWRFSQRERGRMDRPWHFLGGLLEGSAREIAYRYMLEQFGLNKDQFSVGEIAKMHPRLLTQAGIQDPRSYTLGDYRRASEVSFHNFELPL